MIVTVTFNPAIDKTVEINNFTLNQVNRVENIRRSPGGKGINVSKTIHALERKSIAFSIVGGNSGEFIKKSMKELDIEFQFLDIEGETRTNTKIVDYANHKHTDINEKGPSVDSDFTEVVIKKIMSMVNENDILVLSGSLLDGLDEMIYARLIELSNQDGVITILDADDDTLKHGIEAKPSVIKPNIHELERLAKKELDSREAIIEYVSYLVDNYLQIGALVSLGEEGSIWVSKKGVYQAKPYQTDVVSTVGAGDAMVAALSVALAESIDDHKLLKFATASAVYKISNTSMDLNCRTAVEDIMKVIEVVEIGDRNVN